MESLHVLFVSAEADPYVKVGGLGDVAGSLPLALQQHYRLLSPEMNFDIRLVIPFYGLIHKQGLTLKNVGVIPIATTNGEVQATIHEIVDAPIPTYLVSGDPIRLEDPVYSGNADKDADKFVFFSLASLKLPGLLNWRVDILHAQDWHSAVAVHELISLRKKDSHLAPCKSVLTIHNLPYMGSGSENALKRYKVKSSRDLSLPEWARKIPLPMGCSAADEVIAVSKGYADEIITPEYSSNLHEFFLQNKNKLSGIVNGLNTNVWDPSSDHFISQTFSIATLSNKSHNKTAMQIELDLPEDDKIPMVIFIGRLDQQKGIEIAVEALRLMAKAKFQVVLLGSGNPTLEQTCRDLQEEFPLKVRASITFDAAFSHRLYAAGDIILIPSRYEPCGLVQMIAMRYGCIPVARATGGLKDTIDNSSKNRTGYLYLGLDAKSLKNTLTKALIKFSTPEEWRAIQNRAMNVDFSWNRSASAYAEIYDRLAGHKRKGQPK